MTDEPPVTDLAAALLASVDRVTARIAAGCPTCGRHTTHANPAQEPGEDPS